MHVWCKTLCGWSKEDRNISEYQWMTCEGIFFIFVHLIVCTIKLFISAWIWMLSRWFIYVYTSLPCDGIANCWVEATIVQHRTSIPWQCSNWLYTPFCTMSIWCWRRSTVCTVWCVTSMLTVPCLIFWHSLTARGLPNLLTNTTFFSSCHLSTFLLLNCDKICVHDILSAET